MGFLIKPVILATRQTFEGHNFTQTRTFIIAGHREEVTVSCDMKTYGCIKIYLLHHTPTLIYLQTYLMDLQVNPGLTCSSFS